VHRIAGFTSVCALEITSSQPPSAAARYVGEFAVGITNKRNEGRPVGIIFDPLHFGRNIELTPFEVDDPVTLLVAAAANRTVMRPLLLRRRSRLPSVSCLTASLIKTRAINDDELAKTRRDRLNDFNAIGASRINSQSPV